MIKNNICLMTDSYKLQHYAMYPIDTEYVYSYFESRKGAEYGKTLFFGLQQLIKDHFVGKVVTKAKIEQAREIVDVHLGPGAFNDYGWQRLLDKHDGRLPLKIKAVPEGSVIPVDNVLMTVENTDPEFPWLTNYVETILTHVWYPSTVSTLSYYTKELMQHFISTTSENPEAINFMLHDFGYRGVSSLESAGSGGAGHLVNFMGTDTVRAIEFAMQYYLSPVCAYSVPATEHSIMTSLGKDGEIDLMGQLLETYPKGILSVVIDSYNYGEFITKTAERYKEQILARDGKVVFRPDSGDPVEVSLEVVALLDRCFGSEKNGKGYKTLNPKVGMLWGDGIDINGICQILSAFQRKGWSADNIVFGMGGGLLQKVNRDTQRFAFKSCAQCRAGKWYDIWKEPVDKSKTSKKGRLKLIETEDSVTTVPENTDGDDLMVTVFENGELKKDWTFSEVRARATL